MNNRVAVIGSRTFDDYEQLQSALNSLHKEKPITHIVSGGAKGADSLGEKWSKENDIPFVIFIPDWKKYGRSAGIRRNKDIIDNSDIVVAFWDGESRGTKNSIDRAKKADKPCHIHYF